MSTSISISVISPDQYSSTPAYDLLVAAARGHIGIDHRLLHALVDDPARTVPDLVRFGLENRTHDPVNLEDDLVVILQYLKSTEALPFYLDLIRRYSGEMPDDLLAAFHGLGAAAIGPLVDLYDELGEEDGTEIPFVLASLRIHDERVLRVLLDHLDYDAADGALCLGLYGDAAAKPALERLLGELDDADSTLANLRRDVLDAIEQIDTPVQTEELHALDIWDEYPEESAPVFYALPDDERLAFLDSERPDHRAGAAEAFFNEDLSDHVRERLFRVAREDSDVEVRARAWESLAGETERNEIRRAMLDRLHDPSTAAVERAGLVVGLSTDGGLKDVRPHVLALYDDPATRAKALQAMWRSFDRTFTEYFPRHLDDADIEVKRHAIWGCGYLNIVSTLAKLRTFFDDEELRTDALFSYALCSPTEVSPARMRTLLEKIDREARGLTPLEVNLVETALDQRLMMHGRDPIFQTEDDDEEEEAGGHVHGSHCGHHHHHAPAAALPAAPAVAASADPPAIRAGRNDPCPCGSGKKYKKCHGA